MAIAVLAWLQGKERRIGQVEFVSDPAAAAPAFPAGSTMRWIYLAVIAAVAAATLIFALQNLQSVTISFLGLSISAPLAVLVIVIYLIGMATGGSAWALLRWAVQGSKRT